jgi:hypothetical protein
MSGLRCLAIADKPAPLPVVAVWRTGNASVLVRNFNRIAREAASAWRPPEQPG